MSAPIKLRLKDGGPAFPRPFSWDESPVTGMHSFDRTEPHAEQDGMSLRDYFAGQALIAIGPSAVLPANEGIGVLRVARRAYEIADAMLAERAK